MTLIVAKVLVTLDRDGGERYGLDLAREIGVRTGSLYPVLARMAAARLIEGQFEELPLDGQRRRPPRRFYRITPTGEKLVDAAAARLRTEATAMHALISG
jgi:DNA-binding PadR family transcriptional regulator